MIVNFTPTYPSAQTRPALIVQNDRDNARMDNTIVAQITSNIGRAHEDTQLLIDPRHMDWTPSGLRYPSVVNCSSLGYIKQRHIVRVIGVLSASTMQQIDNCLRAALGI